jgi:hypothetical protein
VLGDFFTKKHLVTLSRSHLARPPSQTWAPSLRVGTTGTTTRVSGFTVPTNVVPIFGVNVAITIFGDFRQLSEKWRFSLKTDDMNDLFLNIEIFPVKIVDKNNLFLARIFSES